MEKIIIRLVKVNLFLIDDDYNTFDHVVDCLVSLCDHNKIQKEQCIANTS